MCDMLKERLNKAGMPYTVEIDAELMMARGIRCVPMLETNEGELLDTVDAIRYLSGGKADVR